MINIQPRELWFKHRIAECVIEIQKLNEIEDWNHYREAAKILAEELMYGVTEWDKYYRKI